MLGLGTSLTNAAAIESPVLATNAKSIAFDGTDDFIALPSLTTSGSTTVACWFKMTSTTGQRTLLNFASSSNSDGIMINSYSGRSDLDIAIKYNAGDDSDFNFRTTNTFNDSTWHHIAVVKSSSTIDAVYIDGDLESRATPTLFVSLTAENAIGNNKSSTNNHEWLGNIDEVAIWNSALTATEIKAIYDNINLDFTQNSVGYASSSNLAGWWRMGDEADTRVLDTDANNLIVPDMRKTFFTGKSIDFDSSDDYIIISDHNDLSFGDSSSDSAFSISAWIKMGNATNFNLINKDDAGSNSEYYFTTNGSDELRLVLVDENEGSKIGRKTAALTAHENNWIHVVGTYSGGGSDSNIKIYINGVQSDNANESSGSYTAMENLSADLFIGRRGGNYAEGQITDVAIWNTELNGDTITSLYNSGEPNDLTLSASYTAGSGVDKTSNLQGYWRMGNASNYSFPFIPNKNLASLGDNFATGDGTSVGSGNYQWGASSTFAGSNATCDTTSNSGKMTLKHVSSNNNAYGFWKLAGATEGNLYTVSFDYENPTSGNLNIRAGTGGSYVNSLSASSIQVGSGSGSVALGEHIIDTYEDGDVYIGIHHSDSANQSDITIDNFVVKEITNNAGIMTNMSQYDVVEHAPNRHSGNMIGFDGSDIENDVKT